MDAVLLLLKVVCVFGLLAAVLWVLKRTDGLGGKSRSQHLEVRGTTRLGKGAALTVVRVDGRELLLGVTDHTVTLLSQEDLPDEELAPAAPRAGVLDQLRGAFPALAVRKPGAAAVPDAAVSAALAALRGESAPSTTSTTRSTDGSVTAARVAARRRIARTDALRDEEHPWTAACRPATRSADGDDALL